MNAAILQVQQIINQPATELQRTPGMRVATFSHGWFHPGAVKPDLLLVDVRKTQEFPYRKYQYVTSDLNPGVVFLGSELEFNSMTKYYYTDRSLPKKRLTEAEMLEINQLYRVIGRCERRLDDLENPVPKPAMNATQGSEDLTASRMVLANIQSWIFVHKPVAIGIVAGLLALVIVLRLLRARGSED